MTAREDMVTATNTFLEAREALRSAKGRLDREAARALEAEATEKRLAMLASWRAYLDATDGREAAE